MIDFSTPFTELDGKPMKRPPPDVETDVTLRWVCTTALCAELPGDQSSPQDKFERALLAERIHKAEAPIALKAEEIAGLKDRIGRGFPALVVAQAWRALDPALGGAEPAPVLKLEEAA